MTPIKKRRLRFYLRLEYPVHVTMRDGCFVGTFPDLPALSCSDTSLPRLYATLWRLRQTYITDCVIAGRPVPMPNSRGRHAPAPQRQREVTASM